MTKYGLHSARKGYSSLFVWSIKRYQARYHRLTVARRTVMSSGFPPSVSIPAARAFTAKGERN